MQAERKNERIFQNAQQDNGYFFGSRDHRTSGAGSKPSRSKGWFRISWWRFRRIQRRRLRRSTRYEYWRLSRWRSGRTTGLGCSASGLGWWLARRLGPLGRRLGMGLAGCSWRWPWYRGGDRSMGLGLRRQLYVLERLCLGERLLWPRPLCMGVVITVSDFDSSP